MGKRLYVGNRLFSFLGYLFHFHGVTVKDETIRPGKGKRGKRGPIHGKRGTAIYKLWQGMRERCNNPNNKHYFGYGSRGISVCKEWRYFANFYADMGDKPDGKVLDRIDNNGPYSPSNCRWATLKESANNRRTNRMVTINGVTWTLQEWCDFLKLNASTVRRRVNVYKWSDEEALLVGRHVKIHYYRLKKIHPPELPETVDERQEVEA